jgi:hypothetical protein
MDKDVKTLLCDILLLLLIMVVVVPICVNASNNYNDKKDNMQRYNNVGVNISNGKSGMVVNITNNNSKKVVINLILKTTKFSNSYVVKVDGKEYNLSNVPYSEDEDYYYFNLGSYEVKDTVSINFELNLVGDNIYDDSITYSFLTEVINC